MTVLPIIFILGPSGVGKSKVSSLIEADLQFLHIDFDRPNGFKEFQEQWDSFRKKHNLGPLVSALRNRIVPVRAA